MRPISSSTVAVRSASASVLGSSGQKFGSRRVGAERCVHRAGHAPEPTEAREEAVRLRLEFLERELPAVLRAAHVLLEHAERRVERPADVGVPAREPRDVLEVALRQEAQQLELGVDAGLEPAEDLEDQLLVEDDRRVRLLGCDDAGRRQLGAETGESLERAKLDHAFPGLHVRAGANHVHELPDVTRIGERVELVAAREQLVRLVRSGVEGDLDDLDEELGLALVQRRAVEHARVRHLARLRREPAARRDEVDQSCLSWNQKNPLGARVSR